VLVVTRNRRDCCCTQQIYFPELKHYNCMTLIQCDAWVTAIFSAITVNIDQLLQKSRLCHTNTSNFSRPTIFQSLISQIFNIILLTGPKILIFSTELSARVVPEVLAHTYKHSSLFQSLPTWEARIYVLNFNISKLQKRESS